MGAKERREMRREKTDNENRKNTQVEDKPSDRDSMDVVTQIKTESFLCLGGSFCSAKNFWEKTAVSRFIGLTVL